MSYSAESASPQQALDVGRCVNDAIDVYKQNWIVLTISALVFEILVLLSLTILAGPLMGGICLMLLRAIDREDQSVDFGDMFRSFDRFITLTCLFFLTLIAIVIGYLLCLIPGLLLSTLLLYPFFLIVDRQMGVFAALQASKEIVCRKGFGLNLAVFTIALALELAPSAIPYVGVVISWFVTPLAWLVIASAYIQQVREDQGELDDVLTTRPFVL